VNLVVQEVWHERVWAARPMRLVAERDDALLLWFPYGAGWQRPVPPPHHPAAPTRAERLGRCLRLDEWEFADTPWDSTTLQIWARDAWHAIWVSWRPDGSRWGFYGNIQLPFERTTCGVRTMDLALDVIVERDGSWTLKDEDELDYFVARGIFDRELEHRIRAEAEAIVAKLERQEPPFDGSLDDWRPDPSWERPVLPRGWETLCR
jgi:hypothetical protein